MILAKRPFVPRACRLALITLAGLLAGCQSVDPAPRSAAASGAWRVVERLGDVRYLPPDSAGWSPAVAGNPLPAASQVTTGVGGRVILAGAGRQVSAEPSSRFALPDGLPEHELEQSSGTLRYRIAAADSEPLRIATRFLNLAASESVFEVSVGPHAAEVVVERGQLRIVTPDGRRATTLEAGQSAYASEDAAERLALRLVPDRPLEAVGPIIVPALRPAPEPTKEAPAATPAALLAQPSVSVEVKADVPGGVVSGRPSVNPPPAATNPPLMPAGYSDSLVADRADAGKGRATPAAPADVKRRPEQPVDEFQRMIDRLSDGMVRGLPAAGSVPARPHPG